MSEKVQLEGCICEVNFGYNTRVEEYMNFNSETYVGEIRIKDVERGIVVIS